MTFRNDRVAAICAAASGPIGALWLDIWLSTGTMASLIVLAAEVGKSGVTLERVLAWPEAQPPGPTNAETIGQRLKDQLAEAKIAGGAASGRRRP